MAGKPLNDLGELQRAIMEVVWQEGEATVQQVRAMLRKRNRHAYTSVLTAMQKLEKAGWLTHRVDGKAYVYRATRSREQEEAASLRRFRDDVFAGDPLRVFQALLADKHLSAADLQKLRKMIADRRRELGED